MIVPSTVHSLHIHLHYVRTTTKNGKHKITFSLWEAVKHKLTHKSKTWKIEVTLQILHYYGIVVEPRIPRTPIWRRDSRVQGSWWRLQRGWWPQSHTRSCGSWRTPGAGRRGPWCCRWCWSLPPLLNIYEMNGR